MKKPLFGFTLLELLVAVVILSLLVLGFFNIDFFSRHQVMSTDRRSRMQNEASFILDHMTKHISEAIGDRNNPPIQIPDANTIRIRIDSTKDGRRTSGDVEIAYIFDSNTHVLSYYSVYPGGSPEIISTHLFTDFNTDPAAGTVSVFYNSINNYIDIALTTCWDPTQTSCSYAGNVSNDNVGVNMCTRIKMPSVSTR